MMQHRWIFQLDRKLDPKEIELVTQQSKIFLSKWNAHGTPVPGKADIRYGRFLILEAEEGSTSGCSIDSMTHAVAGIAAAVGAQVQDAGEVAYLDENGEVQTLHFREVKGAIESGKLQANTTVFDNSMNQSSDIAKWQVPLKDSWMGRYLPQGISNN